MRRSEFVLPHDGPAPDIVVAFAFDSDSIQALKEAIEVGKERESARIHVVCVSESDPGAVGSWLLGRLDETERSPLSATSRSATPRVVTHLRMGALPRAAGRLARELDAALMLIGRRHADAHGTENLQRLLGPDCACRVVVIDA